MKIHKTVFKSESEKELFAALQSRWAEHFNVWPSLPFLNVIDVEGDEVTPGEWQHLLKTEVDITLCTKGEDAPVVSIEFDGLGHGFSRYGEYIQIHPAKDPHRKLKLDLKLRIAGQVVYPFLVLSYQEKNPIGPDLTLTIADGLIGQIIAKKYMLEILQKSVSQQPTEDMDHADMSEWFQDQVISAEVTAEIDWNPIARLASQYEAGVMRRLGIKTWRTISLLDPEPPAGDAFPESLEALEARVHAIKNAARIGCRYEVETPKGKFAETAWLRNITGHGVHPLGLAEDIATILTLKRVAIEFGLTDEDILRRKY